jgi:hypothetical protein
VSGNQLIAALLELACKHTWLLVYSQSDSRAYSGKTLWGLKLPVTIGKALYQYEPKSDFFLSLHDIPRVIVEVKSNGSEDDRARMLIQGASLVRLINGLTKKRDFVLMAFYFDESPIFTRYLIYQREVLDGGDNKKVCTRQRILQCIES